MSIKGKIDSAFKLPKDYKKEPLVVCDTVDAFQIDPKLELKFKIESVIANLSIVPPFIDSSKNTKEERSKIYVDTMNKIRESECGEYAKKKLNMCFKIDSKSK